jgi:hypothetical protein
MVSVADEAGIAPTSRWQDGLLCAAMVAVCVLIAHPVAEVALGDDFSYTRSALDFARTGHLVYNGWATASVGWMAVWGALFIKLVGFSFTLMRFAMLPVSMATVYLFQQVLLGFGISRRGAVLGALTLGVCPVFLELTATFLTDIPGLFPVVACLYLCQRAAASRSDQKAIAWLCCAVMVNLIGGTVRQTTWLGALVMVPATALLLRRRRGILAAAAGLLAGSVVSVLLVVHWCNRQPYFDVLYLLPGGVVHKVTLSNVSAQMAKATASLMLMTLPVVVAWVVRWRGVLAGVRVGVVLCVAVAVTALLAGRGELSAWLMPWLQFSLPVLGAGGLPVWIRWLFSVVSVSAAVEWLVQLVAFCRAPKSEMERRALWLLGPFSLVYAFFLVPRGLYGVFDRYLLGLVPGVIVSSLLLYESRGGRGNVQRNALPWESWAILLLFAGYGTAALHDCFSGDRARVIALRELEAAGVPKTAVTSGLGRDGWEQVALNGHVNVVDVKVPAGAFRAVKGWSEPPGCSVQHSYAVPDIRPKYIVETAQSGCFAASEFAPVPFKTWLPPFGRTVFIGRMHADGQ